ncbi:type II 3-dehydroquinate dehydratase [Aliidiomarina haloalkalitolerans]|uniref:3-dehydroquinate dehydratase n=1 Tax=Aliidiomarina haloalkalitolerans TaxID=859059 RepID=A0A432VV23_9GAMM|nr:type II 3-dehydroquinate dehydratase [Aliidiomarina haloalkalitolerans]MCL4409782.1 type II 3-dehydroquinate dehydratase [Gammaproteobacteria bacterium]RUO20322.1 type II 3-dehydroquinate dehydratase [Aliidiomarina haloalkalitolerans]
MTKKHQILVINGPNLNLLGTREPEIYGALTLADIEENLQFQAEQLGCTVSTVQSNAEHELIEYVQQARGQVDFIILNPAAYTHTSVALRDALAAVAIPFIEVHLSNVHAREAFRRHSYFSDLAQAVICGCGAQGYEFALHAAQSYLNKQR